MQTQRHPSRNWLNGSTVCVVVDGFSAGCWMRWIRFLACPMPLARSRNCVSGHHGFVEFNPWEGPTKVEGRWVPRVRLRGIALMLTASWPSRFEPPNRQCRVEEHEEA